MIKVKLGHAVGRACSTERKNQICVQDINTERKKYIRRCKRILEDIIKLDFQ